MSMAESERMTGGELNAAVTREVVRVHTATLGRGPRKSFSFHNGNVLITVLHEVMSRAERNLAASGDEEAVLEVRRRYQGAMEEELRSGVEDLTGCEVVAFLSSNHLEPDIAVEIFILDYPLT